MSTLGTIQTKIAAAVTANETGDYATALTMLRSARMLLSTLPDSKNGSQEMQFRSDIASMIKDIKQAQSSQSLSNNGFSSSKMTFKDPTD